MTGNDLIQFGDNCLGDAVPGATEEVLYQMLKGELPQNSLLESLKDSWRVLVVRIWEIWKHRTLFPELWFVFSRHKQLACKLSMTLYANEGNIKARQAKLIMWDGKGFPSSPFAVIKSRFLPEVGLCSGWSVAGWIFLLLLAHWLSHYANILSHLGRACRERWILESETDMTPVPISYPVTFMLPQSALGLRMEGGVDRSGELGQK